MERQYTVESLREKIKELELRREEEGKIFKAQLAVTYENLKPVNIVKSIVGDIFDSKSLREEFVNTAASYASGLITKKLIVGNSKSPALKLLGLGIQLAMSTLISKNYATVKEIVVQLAGSLISKIQDDLPGKDQQVENSNIS